MGTTTPEREDGTRLPFPDDSIDTAVATCVFCSVADPVAELREPDRVTKPAGAFSSLSTSATRNCFGARLADGATVITRRMSGFRLNRSREDNIADAGHTLVEVGRKGIRREMLAAPQPGSGRLEDTSE